MATATAPKRTLSTAEVRRDEVIAAAMPIFAERGFLATPTALIATAAGISQAYLFRLFPTKLELIVAVCEHSGERVVQAMREAAAQARAAGESPTAAMGQAYQELINDRDVLLTQLHSQAAAASIPEVAAINRRVFSDLFALVETEPDATPESIRGFFAAGMLMNVMASIGAVESGEPWAQTLNVCDESNA